MDDVRGEANPAAIQTVPLIRHTGRRIMLETTALRRAAPLMFAAAMASSAQADLTPEELAKISQNPIGNLISVPFQNNANLNFGPEKKTDDVLNIQPVIPIDISKDWNLITRTILPVISQPEPDGGRTK